MTPTDTNKTWINPLGGLGDTLMVSGVLKQVADIEPDRKFNLVVRTKYPPILQGHPAIDHIGHPPPGARIMGTDYWSEKEFSKPGRRAYQVLARMFGLKPPVEEALYVPWDFSPDPLLEEYIPWAGKNVMISPFSNSPRKQMAIEKWETLVARLRGEGANVVQVGEKTDRYIRGAYSLLGLTTPRQVLSLLGRFDLLLSVDNLLMHGAHLRRVEAVVLWGPTDHRVYGYHDQVHLQADPYPRCIDHCIGPGRGGIYATECPEGTDHCMNTLDIDTILQAVFAILDRHSP